MSIGEVIEMEGYQAADTINVRAQGFAGMVTNKSGSWLGFQFRKIVGMPTEYRDVSMMYE